MDNFCSNCGSKIIEGNKFCQNCGEPVNTMPDTVKSSAPINQEDSIANMNRSAAAHGIHVAAPKDSGSKAGKQAKAAGSQPMYQPPVQQQPQPQVQNTYRPQPPVQPQVQQPTQTQFQNTYQPQPQPVPQYNVPTAQNIPYNQPQPKKKKNAAKIVIPIIAVFMVIVLLFTGLIAPGWMKGNKAKIKSIFSDNSYVDITLPGQSKAMDYTLAVESMAIRSQLNAMLREEKFYRAVENGKPIKEIQKLLDENEEAWETVNKLSTAAYVMSYSLYKSDKNDSKKSTDAMINNPFIMSAYAADILHMDRFDDAKQWAEYITEVYDHAKTNKVAYVAKLLKTDSKRAREAINMAQNILKQESGNNDYVDTEIIKAIKVSKAAGKVSGLILAGIATGGASMGVLSTTGFVASGIDTVIEATDTGMIVCFGEDHQITKRFEADTSKIAPIISIASLTNVTSWGNAADVLGNVRYIVDCGAENYTEGKILGIDFSSTNENGEVKVFKLPIGKDMTDEDKEKLSEVLVNMGYDKDVVKETLEEITQSDKTEAPESTETEIKDLPDEVLDEKIEETSVDEEDYDALFDELFDNFKEEMENDGNLPEDDYLWDYDPDMPPEDLPQPSDEDGDWDDPSTWSTPDMPYDDYDDEYDEGEEAEEGDDEGFDDESEGAKEDEDDEEEVTEEETSEESTDIRRFEGTYSGSYTMRAYAGKDAGVITDSDTISISVIVTSDGKVMPELEISSNSFTWDEATLRGSGTYSADGDSYSVSWRFNESGGNIKLTIDLKDAGHSDNESYLISAHYELTK